MAFIHSVSSTFPTHSPSQKEMTTFIKEVWNERESIFPIIEKFHRNAGIQERQIALQMNEFKQLKGLASRNEAWLKTALELGEKAILKILNSSGLQPQDISLLASTTVTGICAPSLETRLMNRIPFSPQTKRMPFFGLGCLGGVAALNRVHDYLKGHPQEAAILLSVELTSLTFQFDDLSTANLLSTGLFGDGCAAVLLIGDQHPLAKKASMEIVKTHSTFFPGTENIAGWEIVDNGFKILLTPGVADLIIHLPEAVDQLLCSSGVSREEIEFFVSHPGGPKILRKIETVLNLKPDDLKWSWDSLAHHGNMSSTSVLCVLESTLAHPPQDKTFGMMLTFGPGYCAELNLLRYAVQ